MTVADLAFRARALAQAHPLTPGAAAAIGGVVAEQRVAQPRPELAHWAGAAMLAGYCVRCVEEVDEAPATRDGPGVDAGSHGRAAAGRLNRRAADIAAALRAGTPGVAPSPAEERTLAVLDRVIASEVARRLDHLRDDLDAAACAEVEQYLTWCVVHGYAIRVAERAEVSTG